MPKVVCEDGNEQDFPYTEQGLASAASAVGPGCRMVLPGDVELCPCAQNQAPSQQQEPAPAAPGPAGVPGGEVPMPAGGEVMLPPDIA